MIGTLAHTRLAPLEYRYALDAALATLGAAPLVICQSSELLGELRQRLPRLSPSGARAGLWVEPQAGSWSADLAALARDLAPGSPLAIVMSLPLAHLLPERREWQDQPLGMRLHGAARLRGALVRAGFARPTLHGIHSLPAIALNALAAQADRRGRPDLADRLGFAARLRYRASGPAAALATVGLLLTRKR